MTVERFLGAAWASVHGPVDERKLAIWTLDLGFRGLVSAPSPRPIRWSALVAVLEDLPFSIPAARLVGLHDAEPRSDAGLASARQGDRLATIRQVHAAATSTLRLGVPILIMEPGLVPVLGEVSSDDLTDTTAGWTADRAAALAARRNAERDRALDRVCRSLYELCRELPAELTLALSPSRFVTGLGEPEALAAIYEDLGGGRGRRGKMGARLAYWHSPAIAACRKKWLGEDQGAWLERFADRMVGLTLADGTEAAIGELPGSGLVDYGLVASYIPRGAPIPGVLDIDPAADPGEISGAQAFLAKFGL